MQKFSKIYERFINLYLASCEMTEFPKLSAIESRLLTRLTAVWSKDEKVSVMNSTKLLNEISGITCFRHLKSLKTKGYLKYVADASDSRIKLIEPTDLSKQYIYQMGKMIDEAAHQ
jgi:hypothetical protein